MEIGNCSRCGQQHTVKPIKLKGIHQVSFRVSFGVLERHTSRWYFMCPATKQPVIVSDKKIVS